MRLGFLHALDDAPDHWVVDAEPEFWLVSKFHVDIYHHLGIWLLTIAHRNRLGSLGFGIFVHRMVKVEHLQAFQILMVI